MRRTAIIAATLLFFTGCGLFDSGTEWRGGPYALIWIDDPANVTLSYTLGDGGSVGRIESQVFAVGWDNRYLVAKQHPNGNKSSTNYFFIEAARDSKYAEPPKVVSGPFTEAEFAQKTKELNLPPFTKELSSLK